MVRIGNDCPPAGIRPIYWFMQLDDIRTALEGNRLGHPNAVACRAQLDLLEVIVDAPLAAIHLDAPGFAQRFPRDDIPDGVAVHFPRQTKKAYLTFRNLILDAQMLAAPGNVDNDPWASLRRATRLARGRIQANRLYHLSARIPPGTAPQDVTRDLAMEVDRSLEVADRLSFRNGLGACDALQDWSLVVRTGFLPTHRIGRLPAVKDHMVHAPLPSQLSALRDAADRPTQNAVDFLWRLSMEAGCVAPGADPALADIAGALEGLTDLDPASFGMPGTKRTVQKYLPQFRAVLRKAGVLVPTDAVKAAWTELLAAARAAGLQTDVLSYVAVRAKSERLRPVDLTPAWFAAIEAGLSGPQRSGFRQACFRLDALRPAIPARLLPPQPTGLARVQHAHRPSTPPKRATDDAVAAAWVSLFSAARAAGLSKAELNPLYALRQVAIVDRLTPADVTDAWIARHRDQADVRTRAVWAMAARLLVRMQTVPDLQSRVPAALAAGTGDRRKSTQTDLPEKIAKDLEALLSAQGSAASTRRAAWAAVRTAVEITAARYPLGDNLADLLARDLDELDWGRHAARKAHHVAMIARLRAFHDLPWTPDWRALQAACVETGVSRTKNPVPALLAHAEGRGPQALDRTWARDVDRRLRRPSDVSPYGRADLAKTFAANVDRLDALHDLPEVLATGLLPSRIGPVR